MSGLGQAPVSRDKPPGNSGTGPKTVAAWRRKNLRLNRFLMASRRPP